MPISRKHLAWPFVTALVTIVLAGCATTQRGPADWDGLVRQPNTRLDAVFVKPDAEIPSYTCVIRAPATVQFARNWDPNRGGRSLSRRLDAGDMTAIKDSLATISDDRELFAEMRMVAITQPLEFRNVGIV